MVTLIVTLIVQAREVQIRKQYHDTVKTQQRQYKALKEQILESTPKNEQKTTIRTLKDDQARKLAALGQQYEATIADMMQQQNVSGHVCYLRGSVFVKRDYHILFEGSKCWITDWKMWFPHFLQTRLDASQLAEEKELKERLQKELELLMAYQSKIKMQAEAQHLREKKQLEERVSLRRALLEQKVSLCSGQNWAKPSQLPEFAVDFGNTLTRCYSFLFFQMEEETHKFLQERVERNRVLMERQSRNIDNFDLQSQTMGLDSMHIVEATQDTYNEEDLDTASVRGSVLSLTPSNSTNSFSSHSHTQL